MQMIPSRIEQLLRSTLVLVAHPDDESLGCGILLQRMARVGVVLCTAGTPPAARNWNAGIIRPWKTYRRLAEFRAATRIAGVRPVWIMTGIQDQMLYRSLD